jgi:hypothetical protein
MLLAFAERDEANRIREAKEKATLYDRFKASSRRSCRSSSSSARSPAGVRTWATRASATGLSPSSWRKNREADYRGAVLAVSKEHPDLFKRP